MRRTTMDAAYFDALYAAESDPWRFESSAYEQAKYAATLNALPKPKYNAGLEVGCSIGVFTQLLAARCNSVLAIDPAGGALDAARRRCADKPNVSFEKLAAPLEWPQGLFDLIVLSEVVYYFNREEIRRLAHRVKTSMHRHGDIILVHWLGQTDYPLSGDDAVTAFLMEAEGFATLRRQARNSDYRLDLLSSV